MHYYQHHIGDFIKATSRLTDSQAMAYLRLLWNYYDKDGILEYDIEQIAFEIGSDQNTVNLIIKTYFTVDGAYVKQARCDKEIEGYLKKSSGGKDGASKRWGNKNIDGLPNSIPNGLPNGEAMPTQCDPNANHKPITNNHIKDIVSLKPASVPKEVWNDFLKVRKAKKQPLTALALKAIERESVKAGKSITEALTLCCENSWAGFKADWIKDESPTNHLRGFVNA